jgi:putative ABC transport system ATP-binding protein
MVESGEIHLTRERTDGTEELVQRAGPGRYFGELAPLFGMRRTATARAAVESVVNSFTPHDLRTAMAQTAAAPDPATP